MSVGRLEGKVAIVTGAAGGIGAAAAERLAQEGALLVLTDANEHGVQRVADELNGVRVCAHLPMTSPARSSGRRCLRVRWTRTGALTFS